VCINHDNVPEKSWDCRQAIEPHLDKLGFLIAFGFHTRWFSPLLLATTSFCLDWVVFGLEARIARREFAFFVSLSGFILLPVCGVLLITSLS
jgi:hypothetical protein